MIWCTAYRGQRRRRFGSSSRCTDLFKQHCTDKLSCTEPYGQVVAVRFRGGKSKGEHFVTWKVLIYAFVPLVSRGKMDTWSGIISHYWKHGLIDHRCLPSGAIISTDTTVRGDSLSWDVTCHEGAIGLLLPNSKSHGRHLHSNPLKSINTGCIFSNCFDISDWRLSRIDVSTSLFVTCKAAPWDEYRGFAGRWVSGQGHCWKRWRDVQCKQSFGEEVPLNHTNGWLSCCCVT